MDWSVRRRPVRPCAIRGHREGPSCLLTQLEPGPTLPQHEPQFTSPSLTPSTIKVGRQPPPPPPPRGQLSVSRLLQANANARSPE
ncbi:uncharacterized protein CLUP02_08591 [Colletotrichum lupini]|uniref:Uncharacterized protein n=1 Tax=Colletotrichum lupini TaxID=145971 RepID=A0A9Q8STD3_9PEZI|nr:uncharacterized protein CLUP02_08591 [Colletotrichum lupini]UQC83098.1 hypothetical protein CLUP02_08591 [Colletotrichum lupini]